MIVLLSLFVIIKYYQYPLTDNQITRLYNILFSLIMTTYDNEVLLLIALAFSLLPHYQLLIVFLSISFYSYYRMRIGLSSLLFLL